MVGVSRVGFVLKPDKSEAGNLLAKLAAYLIEHGHQPVVLAEDQVNPEKANIVPQDSFADEVDIAVVLGGDGTMLHASALVADSGIPVLGINLGTLGFLVPFDPSEAESALDAAIDGSLDTSERMRLEATYHPAEGEPTTRTALNDVVIHQGAMARLVQLDARLDDDLIASYRADGLIVASPTGSTAYNLAAGGPVVMPGRAVLALTPICAHALTNRPLIAPAHKRISIELGDTSRGVVLTIDGQWAHTFGMGDRLEITASAHPLVVFGSEKGYFDLLREKLHWGVRN
jgi:NAD+ kinase